MNHSFLDVNRSIGRIEPKNIKSPERKRSTVPIYREVEEEETEIDIIQRQHEARFFISASFY